MQTPISFALEILLDCETIEKAHKACRKYIKQLESGQVASQVSVARASAIPLGPVQAPSTQRLLDAQPPAAIPTPPAKIDKETGRAMVATGKGTFGPRKF